MTNTFLPNFRLDFRADITGLWVGKKKEAGVLLGIFSFFPFCQHLQNYSCVTSAWWSISQSGEAGVFPSTSLCVLSPSELCCVGVDDECLLNTLTPIFKAQITAAWLRLSMSLSIDLPAEAIFFNLYSCFNNFSKSCAVSGSKLQYTIFVMISSTANLCPRESLPRRDLDYFAVKSPETKVFRNPLTEQNRSTDIAMLFFSISPTLSLMIVTVLAHPQWANDRMSHMLTVAFMCNKTLEWLKMALHVWCITKENSK